MSQDLILALVILGIIALSLLIITLVFHLLSIRRRLRLYRKADLLVEDLTYKSETLTPAVEALSRLANYIDIFEATTRKSLKAAVRLVARNRDDIYKFWARFRQIALGETAKANAKPKAVTKKPIVARPAQGAKRTTSKAKPKGKNDR